MRPEDEWEVSVEEGGLTKRDQVERQGRGWSMQDHSLKTRRLGEMDSSSRHMGQLPALLRTVTKDRRSRHTDLFNQVFGGLFLKELDLIFNALLQKVYLAFIPGAWLFRLGLLLERRERKRRQGSDTSGSRSPQSPELAGLHSCLRLDETWTVSWNGLSSRATEGSRGSLVGRAELCSQANSGTDLGVASFPAAGPQPVGLSEHRTARRRPCPGEANATVNKVSANTKQTTNRDAPRWQWRYVRWGHNESAWGLSEVVDRGNVCRGGCWAAEPQMSIRGGTVRTEMTTEAPPLDNSVYHTCLLPHRCEGPTLQLRPK